MQEQRDGLGKVRFTLTLRGSESADYDIDDVLTAIAQIVIPCNHQTHQLGKQADGASAEEDAGAFACDYCISRRDHHKYYLQKQLQSYSESCNVQIRDWKGQQVRHLSNVKAASEDERRRLWMLGATIQGTDLVEFCRRERGRVTFEPANESIKHDSDVASAEDTRSGYPVSFAEQVTALGGASQSQVLNSRASAGRKQTRQDAISVIIDEILTADPTLQPTKLMKELQKRAGDGGCISATTSDGIKWEPYNGRERLLTVKGLGDRIQRWRKKHP